MQNDEDAKIVANIFKKHLDAEEGPKYRCAHCGKIFVGLFASKISYFI
jgi:transposase-like protein